MASSNSWSLDISSFMILVGDQQETSYRLMQRCVLECLTAAPVAGLQSYMRPFASLAEIRGPDYISPFGCKTAPLRNMRLSQTITSKDMIPDGRCTVYQITGGNHSQQRTTRFIWLLLWVSTSWLVFGAIIASVYLSHRTTWIGTSSCASLTVLSIFIRLVENRCLDVPTYPPSSPTDLDAAVFMGRRNSCMVLEGSRRDVARWTGFGLKLKRGIIYKIGEISVRLASLFLLLFVFVTVPNGSTWDQVAFVCLNLLGQLNNILGISLNSSRCLTHLRKTDKIEAETRTHVLAFLLRRFGDGPWVDEVNLLPGTEIWKSWRAAVLGSALDAKALYDQCSQAKNSETRAAKIVSASA